MPKIPASQREINESTIKALAAALAPHVAELLRTHVAPAGGITMAELAKAWTSGEIAREYTDYVRAKATAGKDAERFKTLNRAIGHVPVAAFTLADAERAMASLPPGLASATRRQYAQLIARALNLAVYPLKLIERSPLPRSFLPKVTRSKATAWLYPAEDVQLLGCKLVPLERRVLYGMLAREGLRCGEALNLSWPDLDLRRGVIRLDANKTDEPRVWMLTPGVPAALERFRPFAKTERVFTVLNETRLAEAFRTDLRFAKIDRSELFERTKTRQPIRVHDLRATFVTLALANGKTEAWVSDRTGHTSSLMINRYRRAARMAAELDLGELKPLNEAVVWAEEPRPNKGRYSAENLPPRSRAHRKR